MGEGRSLKISNVWWLHANLFDLLCFFCTRYMNRSNTLLLHGCCRLEATWSRIEAGLQGERWWCMWVFSILRSKSEEELPSVPNGTRTCARTYRDSNLCPGSSNLCPEDSNLCPDGARTYAPIISPWPEGFFSCLMKPTHFGGGGGGHIYSKKDRCGGFTVSLGLQSNWGGPGAQGPHS